MARMREERLAHAAFLYYIQGQSQADIAATLGVTRSNVSRMLTAAREQYIVRFEIAYPLDRDPVLEQRLTASFAAEGVREVIVVPTRASGVGRASHGLLNVGQACSAWLDINLRDQDRLGLCWGSTIEAMVESSHFDRRVDVEVVQIAGELSIDSRFSGHDLVRNLAQKLGGRYRYFNAPAAIRDEETAIALAQTPQVAEATSEETQEALDLGAVGQICGRFYNDKGDQIDLAISRRTLSLDLDEITAIQTVVVVASGSEKAKAVRAAIRGGFVQVLIVDDSLAQGLAALP